MAFRCTACSRRAPGALTARTARITSHCNATIRQPARQLSNMGQPRATPTPETETLHWNRTRYNTLNFHVIKIPAIELWVLQIPRAPGIVSSNRITEGTRNTSDTVYRCLLRYLAPSKEDIFIHERVSTWSPHIRGYKGEQVSHRWGLNNTRTLQRSFLVIQ